jgi:hypothetical protein
VFQVQNVGGASTFAISVNDDKGFVTSITPNSVTLATNQSGNLTVQIQAPSNTVPAISETLTFSATSTEGVSNFAVLSSTVGYPAVAPAITDISPKMGPVGTTVTISGTGFRDTQGAGMVTFNGAPAMTVGSWSDMSITAVVPAGATTGNIVVAVGGLTSNGITFKVH